MVREEQPNRVKDEIIEWAKALVIALAVVLLMRWLLFTPTIVSGPSMEPNFDDRERLIVNKIIYSFREPKRGEVIVFHAPEAKDYIKRVIALPGETVRVEGDDVYINGDKIHEPYIADAIEQALNRGTFYNSRDFRLTSAGVEDVVVPEDSVFVMGDNRPNSKDSRMDSVGFIPFSEIVGRADLVFWPITDFRIVRHPKASDFEVAE